MLYTEDKVYYPSIPFELKKVEMKALLPWLVGHVGDFRILMIRCIVLQFQLDGGRGRGRGRVKRMNVKGARGFLFIFIFWFCSL